MFGKSYNYFISYYWTSEKTTGLNGFGSIHITANKPLEYYNRIEKAREWLCDNIDDKKGGKGAFIILNFIRLKG